MDYHSRYFYLQLQWEVEAAALSVLVAMAALQPASLIQAKLSELF